MAKMNETFDCAEEEKSIVGGDNVMFSPDYVTTRIRPHDFKAFEDKITKMLNDWFIKQDSKMTKIMEDFADVKTSVEFMSAQYDALLNKFTAVQGEVKNLERRVFKLEQSDEQMGDLKDKLEAMEQRARQCNVELGNLPERKSEKLQDVVLSIGTAIKHPISRSDIVAVHRVPHADSKNKLPRNVVIKFQSQLLRDDMLAAYRVAKGVHSDEINIPGDRKRLFLNEHLTLNNKILFREVREAAKIHSYKYVWIKHGAILVRKKEDAAAFCIRSREDISKIKSDTTPTPGLQPEPRSE